MNIKSIINGTYRQTAPDVENGSPSVSATDEMAAPSEPEAIVDEGQDIIPEEVSLWDSLNEQLDEPDDDETEDSPEVDTLSTPEPEPKAPAVEEETPEAETPEVTAADTALPTDPVQPTIEPEPEPVPIPQKTEAEIAEETSQRRTQLEASLTERFGLTDNEALQLVTDPGKVFPKLQARMFTDMWLHVEAMIDQRLPTVIEKTTQDMKIRDEKVNDFFTAWPQLDRKKHGVQVAQVARAWSQVNQNASEEEVIRNVGMQVMMMNGIAPSMTPVDPQTESLSAETPPSPHRPAAVNGARATPQQSRDNLFEAMSYELDEDED